MKKIFKILFSVLVSVSFVTPFLINDVKANDTRNIEVPYEEPLIDSNHGYVSVLFQNNSTGAHFVMTFVWSITNESAKGGNSGMKLVFTDNTIEFISQLPTNENGYSFIYRYNGAGSDITVGQYQYFTTSSNPTYKYSTSSYTIKGYHANGNVKHITDEITTKEAFTVSWGSECEIKERLDSLIEVIQTLGVTESSILTSIESIQGNVSTIKSKVNSIYTKLTNIDTNVTNIYNSMSAINTWLNSIDDKLGISNTYLNAIKTTLSSINNKIGQIYDELSGNIRNLLTDIKTLNQSILTTVNNIYTDLITNIHEKLDKIYERLDKLYDNGVNVNEEYTDELQLEMNDNVDELIDIENTIFGRFENSLKDIKPQTDIFTQSDFVKTGVFLSTQMTNIYNSNNIFKMTITFGLIIGIAFTIIGISLKR